MHRLCRVLSQGLGSSKKNEGKPVKPAVKHGLADRQQFLGQRGFGLASRIRSANVCIAVAAVKDTVPSGFRNRVLTLPGISA